MYLEVRNVFSEAFPPCDFQADDPNLIESFRARHPERAPQVLGDMGYIFTWGIYVKGPVRDAAYRNAALALEYYRNYNASVHQPVRFFHGLSELEMEDFLLCSDSTTWGADFTNTAIWANYVKWTGDLEGVTATPEGYVARQYDVLHYWWEPDEGEFTDLDESRLVLPEHNALEHAEGRSSQFLADEIGQTHQCVSGLLCARLASTKAKLAKSGVFFATLGPSQQMKGRLFAHHVAVVHMCGNDTDFRTTTTLADDGNEKKWIEVQGAISESYCRCAPGRFLQNGTCLPCGTGSSCPGSNALEVLPGFHSKPNEPAVLFQCFGNPARCPGGVPGTCASGWDSHSPGCSECLTGLQPSGAECLPCSAGDYFRLLFFGLLVIFATGVMHILISVGGHGSNRLQSRLANHKPTWQISILIGTLGSLCLLFFILICFVCLEPFRCNEHPNGLATMQTAHSVFCNFTDQHLSLCIMALVMLIAPVGFLAVLGLLLMASVILVTYYKPWRSILATQVDIAGQAVLLVLLLLSGLSVQDEDLTAVMILCTIVASLLVFVIVLAAGYSFGQYVRSKIHKPYRFFLCHHKAATAALARWLKMELEGCGARFKTFIDLDSLTDLTQLFSYVSTQVETLAILGSPQLVMRKWCVGEIVTARLFNVQAVLVSLPDFSLPDEDFINDYGANVPEIIDLTTYGYGLSEVKASLRWLWTMKTIRVKKVSARSVAEIVGELTEIGHKSGVNDGLHVPSIGGCIVVDHDNTEALAAAHVLARFLAPMTMDRGVPIMVIPPRRTRAAATANSALSPDLDVLQELLCLFICDQVCSQSTLPGVLFSFARDCG
ncbi:unnamed protein product [Durusdinium trenchii]|uniref:Uncharacterized protein n=1 Tax=Durusdinium trenchii TaxID=1381693 RepID=A0ABP0H9T5_9DINO